jgi:hypothetical protein
MKGYTFRTATPVAVDIIERSAPNGQFRGWLAPQTVDVSHVWNVAVPICSYGLRSRRSVFLMSLNGDLAVVTAAWEEPVNLSGTGMIAEAGAP